MKIWSHQYIYVPVRPVSKYKLGCDAATGNFEKRAAQALLILFFFDRRDTLTAGWAGLTISFALSITENFNWVLQHICEMEVRPQRTICLRVNFRLVVQLVDKHL